MKRNSKENINKMHRHGMTKEVSWYVELSEIAIDVTRV